jgi:hypothetical protein
MIHTVHLDDKYYNIRCLLQEINRQEQGVHFEQSFVSDKTIQEEYITSDEFWKEADRRIIKVCEQYGILQ